jgi:DNA-binding protein H-NS
MNQDINWWDKAVDWAWGLVLAVGLGVIEICRRVIRHEARLDALEKADRLLEQASAERGQQLRDIETKIDQNQDKVLEGLAAVHREITAERKENNENYRLVLAQLLERVPKA